MKKKNMFSTIHYEVFINVSKKTNWLAGVQLEKYPFLFMQYGVNKEFKCQNTSLHLQRSIDLNNLYIFKLFLTQIICNLGRYQ